MILAFFLNLFLGSPALRYESVICTYSESETVKKTVSQKLITITIDADFGRFAEIQFGDDTKKIQYQILLENDANNEASVNILQNFLIGDLESSAEFSADAPKYTRIAQGAHSVRCELVPVKVTAPATQN
ncbi:hypothetical protein AZI86_17195 [Bdellovibrio bacteriovorus]|uniref:Uncharacterized protein n=1 Tax=Bdellovibrio bacteriovorus TaxID=959 RepID=A0A150WEA3_BDEBC|nr:hypothetical protein AZI86_17195 [Bdellovibrio bacteriovorus]